MKRRILVRVDGSSSIGLGHVYNMLTILHHFRKDDLMIVMNSKKRMGFDRFKKSGYKIKLFTNKTTLHKIINRYKPDIIFNDILNTNLQYMKALKKFNCMLVNFEDLGIGRKYADLVFNPIYYSKIRVKNEFYGDKFACIRDEFREKRSITVRKQVEKISITFGGTDPTNKVFRVLKIIHEMNLVNIQYNVILGLGYLPRKKIKNLASRMTREGFKITIVEKPDKISEYIQDSDFTITSNGRTVFEIGIMGIPMIAVAVNSRERKHSFVKYSKGGFHLDVNSNLENKLPIYIMKMLDFERRKKFSKNLTKLDLLNGVNQVINLINSNFKKGFHN